MIKPNMLKALGLSVLFKPFMDQTQKMYKQRYISSPATAWTHRSKTFKKNKRKGL